MVNYNPFYKHIQQASILSEYVIKRKFATYKIVSFELISGGPEHRDIYRMSENPPVWLGVCSEHVYDPFILPYYDIFRGLPVLFAYPPDREHLNLFVNSKEVPGMSDANPINGLMNYLIEVSEKEFELYL